MATYTFTALQNELFDRGLKYLDDGARGTTRVQNWVNSAYREIVADSDWPFLQATATGPAPITIADLGTIESVINVATLLKLVPVDRRNLTDVFPVLTTAGIGEFYYVTGGTVINVYPADTASTLQVLYWKSPPDLSASTDVPIVPAQYQELIILAALRRGFTEDNDAGDAQIVQAELDRGLTNMREDLLNLQADKSDYVAQIAPQEGW